MFRDSVCHSTDMETEMEIPTHPLASKHVDDTLFLLHEALTEDADDPRLNVAWQWKLQGYADLVQYLRECVDGSQPENVVQIPVGA